LRHLQRTPCQVLPLRVKLYRSHFKYGWLHFSGMLPCPLLPADYYYIIILPTGNFLAAVTFLET
jgi:hypothetical protein